MFFDGLRPVLHGPPTQQRTALLNQYSTVPRTRSLIDWKDATLSDDVSPAPRRAIN